MSGATIDRLMHDVGNIIYFVWVLLSLLNGLIGQLPQRTLPRRYSYGHYKVFRFPGWVTLEGLDYKILQREDCSTIDDLPIRLGSNLLWNVYCSEIVVLCGVICNREFLLPVILPELISWLVCVWFPCVIFDFLCITSHKVKRFSCFGAPI